MSYRDEIIEKIRSHYSYLSSEFGVKKIGLFGSVARQSENADSDIDLIVEFDRQVGIKFVLLADYMEEVFNRKVDILTTEGIRNIGVKSVSEDIERDIIYV